MASDCKIHTNAQDADFDRCSICAHARIRELEACVLEYWHAKDWAAVGAADSTAAKLLPADMKARAALASGNTEGKR